MIIIKIIFDNYKNNNIWILDGYQNIIFDNYKNNIWTWWLSKYNIWIPDDYQNIIFEYLMIIKI